MQIKMVLVLISTTTKRPNISLRALKVAATYTLRSLLDSSLGLLSFSASVIRYLFTDASPPSKCLQ